MPDMSRRSIALLALAALLGGLFSGLWLVHVAYRPYYAQGGVVVLSGTASVTAEHQIALDITWNWAIKNPRPGMADEIIILGPDEWQRFDAPQSSPPVNHVASSEVDFGTEYGGGQASLLEATGTVKAHASVTPNVDGAVTVYLNTDGNPAELTGGFTFLYLTVEYYPVPPERASAHRPTLSERLIAALGLPTHVDATPTRIRFGSAAAESLGSPRLPPTIAALLPAKAGWHLFGASSLNMAEPLFASQEVRIALEVLAQSTRVDYRKYGEPRVLIAPAGTDALIVYEDERRLITIPVSWAGGAWSLGHTETLAKP